MVTEARLDPSYPSVEFNTEGYTPSDDKDLKRCGILLFIKDFPAKLKCIIIERF